MLSILFFLSSLRDICGTLYTCWTAPSLTFDLLCRSRLMSDEVKLSPTSASICTTNRMLGEALSNKCFIMPKSLNDNIKKLSLLGQILSCSDDKYFQVNYILNTHACGSQICYFVLTDL